MEISCSCLILLHFVSCTNCDLCTKCTIYSAQYDAKVCALNMRPRRLCFYLLLGTVAVSVLLLFIQGRIALTASNSFTNHQSMVSLHGLEPTLTLPRRPAVSRLAPDLKWLKKLDKQALSTVPSVSSPNCSHSIFLVILVVSSPENFQQRNAIRGSWAKLFHSKNRGTFKNVFAEYGPENLVKTVFLVGKSDTKETQGMVDSEAELYDDIVSGNFDDKYENLVLKTRLGLTWAHSFCPSAYVLKTDDDVFVNIRKLVEWLLRSPEADFYTGWCNYRSKVSRNKLSKWYVSVEDYGEEEFPPYCLGGGYLMSSDIISKVIKTTYMEHIFPLEDIFIGVAINKINVQPLDNRNLFNMLFSGMKDLCDYLNIILLHPVNNKELLSMHLQADLAQRVCP